MIKRKHALQAVLEGLLALITTIILFNTYSDFAIKIGLTSEPLVLAHIQLFGYLAAMTTAINAVTHTFFGFTLVR